MTQLEAFGDDVEGQAVRSMVEGVGELSSVFENRMQKTLDEKGIEEESDVCRGDGDERIYRVSW